MLVSTIEKEPLTPKIDIVVYSGENKMYVEYCHIVKGKLTSYQPLSYQAFSALITSTKENKTFNPFGGKIPENVIDYDNSSMFPYIVWVVKRKVRHFHWAKKVGTLYYPHLIFKLQNNALFIYAVKTSKITNSTMLYKCPFPNVYDDQHLCFGTMNISDYVSADFIKTMKGLEDCFFGSKFTGEMMGSNQAKGFVSKILVNHMKSDKSFPLKYLVQFKTLRNVLR